MSHNRSRGLSPVIATQRIAKVNKDIIAQAEMNILMKAVLDIDLDRYHDSHAAAGLHRPLVACRQRLHDHNGHVIHSLRRAGTQRQHATFTGHFTELSERITATEQQVTKQYSELVQRTANRLSVHITEQLERTVGEYPTRTELANITETVQAHTQTLTELAALPGLLERLQQELQAAMEAHTAQQHRLSAPNTAHPKLSVVGANSEQRTAKHRTVRANSAESDKGAFVRHCLTETPDIRNTDIQRKASEQGITISPAYISEIRKAFFRGEQTA